MIGGFFKNNKRLPPQSVAWWHRCIGKMRLFGRSSKEFPNGRIGGCQSFGVLAERLSAKWTYSRIAVFLVYSFWMVMAGLAAERPNRPIPEQLFTPNNPQQRPMPVATNPQMIIRRDPGLPPECISTGCPECWVTCQGCEGRRRGGWELACLQSPHAYAHGQYLLHSRMPHVAEYRLRVDDQLEMIYRLTREETSRPYRLNVGDEIRIESFTDPELNRDLIIQPDGTITLRLLGQVRAKGLTVAQLRDNLEQAYTKYYKVPAITVTPLRVNTKLEDLRASVDRRYGAGGQGFLVRVNPEGTISLPGIGAVQAQGLTLAELQRELNERYRQLVEGIEVIPVLVQRAPRYIYVLGEVRTPGRFELTGPTTLLQAISMAGGWNIGANLRQVVVFRRTEDWRLMATMVNLEPALMGKQACPAGEIWLADSDVVILPKSTIQRVDDFIELVFTRGIYGVIPFQTSINFSKLNSL
ncbi:MAG: polysaccharide biosynthesis/export family protein [Thermoguttaceae bacterium]|nr:polysaccharide biosynthesis/export family protein [Thermoguttaceae bacterium]MDW8038943.1 polysaccharide biosynthesis/export family protein [Thermoguttaceae bacterium]